MCRLASNPNRLTLSGGECRALDTPRGFGITRPVSNRNHLYRVASAAALALVALSACAAGAPVPVTLVKGLFHPWGLAFLPDFERS